MAIRTASALLLTVVASACNYTYYAGPQGTNICERLSSFYAKRGEPCVFCLAGSDATNYFVMEYEEDVECDFLFFFNWTLQ